MLKCGGAVSARPRGGRTDKMTRKQIWRKEGDRDGRRGRINVSGKQSTSVCSRSRITTAKRFSREH